MDVGWGMLCAIAGAVLYTAFFLVASRANRGIRMPWWTNPPRNTAWSLAGRSLGAGLTVWGVIWTSTLSGPIGSALLVALVMFVPMFVIIGLHNRRVGAQDQDFASSART